MKPTSIVRTLVALIALASAGCGPEAPSAVDASSSPTTVRQFDRRVLEAPGAVLVSFYATWCPTCKIMKPRMEQLERDFADEIDFVWVDVDQAPELVKHYRLERYPTLILFADGLETGRWVGETSKSVLTDALTRATRPDVEGLAVNERSGAITFGGDPLTLIGPQLAVGDQAPDAMLLANDLSPAPLSSLAGKVQVISVVPSLDTGVCDIQTKRFNAEAAKLGDDVAVLTVSMDLPFAQGRWVYLSNVDSLQVLSDHRDAAFGRAYGVLIKELRLLARSVFVVDRDGIIRYIEIVPEMTSEPNYDAALSAAAALAAE